MLTFATFCKETCQYLEDVCNSVSQLPNDRCTVSQTRRESGRLAQDGMDGLGSVRGSLQDSGLHCSWTWRVPCCLVWMHVQRRVSAVFWKGCSNLPPLATVRPVPHPSGQSSVFEESRGVGLSSWAQVSPWVQALGDRHECKTVPPVCLFLFLL